MGMPQIIAGTIQIASPPIEGVVVTENLIFGVVDVEQTIVGVVKEEGPLMTVATNHLALFIRNDRTFPVSVNYSTTGNPVDLTGAKIWFTVKTRPKDEDADALVFKRNTAAGGGDTEIKVTNVAGGQLDVYLVPADTENVDMGTYDYGIRVTLANGKTYTIVRDKITLKEDVTKTLS